MCLRDDRREERVIVSPAAFKEINIIFFFIRAPAMGMSVLAHLFCRISSGGEDIVLSMLLKERRYKFSSFFWAFWHASFCRLSPGTFDSEAYGGACGLERSRCHFLLCMSIRVK